MHQKDSRNKQSKHTINQLTNHVLSAKTRKKPPRTANLIQGYTSKSTNQQSLEADTP
jgi:hypothetical protein